MKTHYTDSKPATTESKIYVADVRKLVHAAKRVLNNFDRRGTDVDSSSDEDFSRFVKLLYSSGMVMKDFDGPLFDKGPGQLIRNSVSAPVTMSRANLLTIRMFLHTLARGHRATDMGSGYSYFDEAYKSGGLKALFDRLEWLCEVVETNGSATFSDGAEIQDDD